MSLRAKEEYLRAVHGRYRQATRATKGQILDGFCAATGYHRKSALRRLHGPRPGRAYAPPERPARLCSAAQGQSSSRIAFASRRSAVSKPSVNQS